MIEPNAVYRLEEAAIRSGIGYTTLYNAVRRGELTASRAEGAWRVRGSDVLTWIEHRPPKAKVAHWLLFDAAVATIESGSDTLVAAIRAKAVLSRVYSGELQVNAKSLAEWRDRNSAHPDDFRDRLARELTERTDEPAKD